MHREARPKEIEIVARSSRIALGERLENTFQQIIHFRMIMGEQVDALLVQDSDPKLLSCSARGNDIHARRKIRKYVGDYTPLGDVRST
jgi:hypothetical protein